MHVGHHGEDRRAFAKADQGHIEGTIDDGVGHLTGGEGAEAFKFLGPRLILDGFKLKKILGERMQPANIFELYNCNPDFQL